MRVGHFFGTLHTTVSNPKEQTPDMSLWHTLSHKKLEETLATNFTDGLDQSRIEILKTEYGQNRLPPEKRTSGVLIFARQFKSPLILVLIGSAAVLFGLGSWSDAFIILFVLVFNASIGTLQEGRAQHTLEALKKFLTTQTTVIRGGKELIIPDTECVPGDIVLLSEGEKIPADARLLEVSGLRVDESALTGESLPVDKTDAIIKKMPLALTGRMNMVYKGTTVVAGSARAVIVATGVHTEIGRISTELITRPGDIPLAREIASFSRSILLVTVTICAVLFTVGVLVGKSVITMFGTVVSLSVSIIPEGLPIVLTLVLANGVWRMAKRNAIIKRMQAVEALGQADVIAVDKTGTITKNEMVVRTVYTPRGEFSVSGSGYGPDGSVTVNGASLPDDQALSLSSLVRIATLNTNAHLAQDGDTGQWRVSGDPTEAAIVVLAQKFGTPKEGLFKDSPRIAELPFHTKNKYHATLHTVGQRHLLCVGGAPEVILERCANRLEGASAEPLTEKMKTSIKSDFERLSEQGLRVIAFGFAESGIKNLSVLDHADVSNLTFVGAVCIEDSVRSEVPAAVDQAHNAGIRVIMMTGDSPVTARAIAGQAHIFRSGDRILTGDEIDAMDADEFARAIGSTSVFARMTPEHKLKIVDAVKLRGEIIAMTGDGVNDAPALVAADLGIAMGKIGTEVAKEAADIVLVDDNFTSIIAAVEEGRTIMTRIKRVILYLFANNGAEVLLIAASLFMGLPLPLLPAQIIWLNLITDSFLDISIGMEPTHGNTLNHRRNKHVVLFDRLMALRVVLMSLPATIAALVVFSFTVDTDYIKAMTLSMTIIAVSQWFNAWNCRSEHTTVFTRHFFSNHYLLGAIAFVATLHVTALSTPFLQGILHTTPLSLVEWALCIAIGALTLIPEEIRKGISRMTLAASPLTLQSLEPVRITHDDQ